MKANYWEKYIYFNICHCINLVEYYNLSPLNNSQKMIMSSKLDNNLKGYILSRAVIFR